jgi:hypothetical protein
VIRSESRTQVTSAPRRAGARRRRRGCSSGGLRLLRPPHSSAALRREPPPHRLRRIVVHDKEKRENNPHPPSSGAGPTRGRGSVCMVSGAARGPQEPQAPTSASARGLRSATWPTSSRRFQGPRPFETPTARTLPVSSTCKSFACKPGDISPISSSNTGLLQTEPSPRPCVRHRHLVAAPARLPEGHRLESLVRGARLRLWQPAADRALLSPHRRLLVLSARRNHEAAALAEIATVGGHYAPPTRRAAIRRPARGGAARAHCARPLAGAKAVQLSLWFWAGVSKLNHHFPTVVCVMTSNGPFTRFPWLRRRMYREFPGDLRPSRLATNMAHAGTVLEFSVPLAFLLTPLGTPPVASCGGLSRRDARRAAAAW